MYNDYIGQRIQVGDRVACLCSATKGRVITGLVDSFTPMGKPRAYLEAEWVEGDVSKELNPEKPTVIKTAYIKIHQ